MSRQICAGEKVTVKFLCETFKISRDAYYNALRGGARKRATRKVVRMPSRPKGASAADVLAAIKRVIAREPAWGVRKVWATIRREDGLRVSRKRVWAIMNANELTFAHDREPGEVTRGHVIAPEPNRRWATDLTTVHTRRDGVVAIVPTIDCGCRSILALRVTKDQLAPDVLDSVRDALRSTFGVPALVPPGIELRTDHGPQYTGGDCTELVKEWGLEHTFAPVGRPTGNAVVERVIRTMKEEVIWLRDWDTADQVAAALASWWTRYNTQRPHQALDWLTPAEFRTAHLGSSEQQKVA
jgi:putative transposase